MQIPIIRVKLSENSVNEVAQTLQAGMIAEGKKTQQFEQEFAKYIGVKHAITTLNGTMALQLAIKSLRISNGEIITTPFTFIASANSIIYNNLKPVFADINPETFNLDPQKIVEKITNKTKAIMPVHLFGQPCEMKEFKEICEDHDLYLIEDSAQAHGAEYYKQKTGSLSDLGCFSFYATKNMTTGEGGMITTNSDTLAKRIKLYRNHGQTRKYEHTQIGYNYRMNDILSSIGLRELEELDNNNSKRILNAEKMNSQLKINTPKQINEIKHVYHQYVIKTDNREALQKHLMENGIGTAIHYPIPVHKQKSYKKIGYIDNLFNAEQISKQVLSLPIHQHLTEEEVDYIIKTINKF
ncbi:MAG: DegT/DnrJ/EryC1/StrS family aminotransferase [Nanoarchaeota archaeon]|nr:DegT/DnrJ/EryC1/StrS family aminotransferase [Nanoarchaeota archaeon]